MKTMNKKRGLLILALTLLFSFISFFVGAGISRNHIRKELVVMKENTDKRSIEASRLSMLEERNNNISFIIGKDEEIEKQIEALRTPE